MSRGELTAAYSALRASVSAAITADDPTGLIEMGAPRDEYDPEVGTILPRLKEASSARDVQQIVFEEFTAWFGPDMHTLEQFEPLADELWTIWQAAALPH